VVFAAFLGARASRSGAGTALTALGVTVGVALAATMVSAAMLRHPARSSLQPLDREWPAYARRRVQALTDELRELGFAVHSDRLSSWRLGSQEKHTFIRFLIHPSRRVWAEIHALGPAHRLDPVKLVARALRSVRADGTTLTTCDRQANEEFFRDPLTRVHRVPARASCRDMLAAHQARMPADAVPVDDPPARHAQIYEGWVSRMADARQVAVKGEHFVIPLRRVPATALRAWGAWLQ
jgi:hypothetical protein